MTKIFDIPVFDFINHTISNDLFNIVMPMISRMGQGELYFLIGIMLLLLKKREFKLLGIALLAGLTLSYYIAGTLKILVARPRPFVALTNVILLGSMDKTPSFPSGHATSAFMIAVLLSGRFKKYALFYAFAALVAFSRVYIGVHYPSDVIAGSLIGAAIGFFLTKTLSSLRAPEAGSNT
jgi:undecaprenyl-diphosphatase